ncbi:MAG: hypothetical protein FWC36_00270 [Spirochaetes bacterium]|nr:hypothetical protein [Spirochaetota bacterium]
MKKILLFFILCVSSLVFPSPAQEIWISLGHGYGFLAEEYTRKGRNIAAITHSIDFHLTVYTFFRYLGNFQIGIFAHCFFAFPQSATINDGVRLTRTSFDNHDTNRQIGFIIGPGLRINLSDNVQLRFGSGIGFLYAVAHYFEYVSQISRNVDFAGCQNIASLKTFLTMPENK